MTLTIGKNLDQTNPSYSELILGNSQSQTNPSHSKALKAPEGKKMETAQKVIEFTKLYLGHVYERECFSKEEAKQVCNAERIKLDAQIAELKKGNSSVCNRIAAAIAIFLVGTLIFS